MSDLDLDEMTNADAHTLQGSAWLWIPQLVAALRSAEARITELAAYVEHKVDCPSFQTMGSRFGDGSCKCGLDQAGEVGLPDPAPSEPNQQQIEAALGVWGVMLAADEAGLVPDDVDRQMVTDMLRAAAAVRSSVPADNPKGES